jgi:hypothetical protein
LRLCEDRDTAEVGKLDIDHLRARLDEVCPGWDDADGESCFECSITPRSIAASFSSSAAAVLKRAFQALAQETGLVLFDPQLTEITDAEEAAFAAELEAEQARECLATIEPLRKRAEAGDAEAQAELGNRYTFGEGVRKDLPAAFEWYRRAAELGDPTGMYNLAACYRQGDGTPRNLALAMTWLERALKQEPALAPFALGEMHARGEGVPVDLDRAAEYFQIALRNRHPCARKALREIGRDA